MTTFARKSHAKGIETYLKRKVNYPPRPQPTRKGNGTKFCKKSCTRFEKPAKGFWIRTCGDFRRQMSCNDGAAVVAEAAA
jgi:hypothetical protein